MAIPRDKRFIAVEEGVAKVPCFTPRRERVGVRVRVGAKLFIQSGAALLLNLLRFIVNPATSRHAAALTPTRRE